MYCIHSVNRSAGSLHRKVELSKQFRRYWASACASLAAAFLIAGLLPDAGMIAGFCLEYAPVLVLAPLLEFLGLEGTAPSLAASGGFCLFQWAVCRFLVKESQSPGDKPAAAILLRR